MAQEAKAALREIALKYLRTEACNGMLHQII
jgi:hypothetical protein